MVATNMAGRGTDIKLSKELSESIASSYASHMSKTLEQSNTFVGTIYSELEYSWLTTALDAA